MNGNVALAFALREKQRRDELGPAPRPQIGPQSEFWNTKADIAIYGGAAGAGKTFALLLEPTKHTHNGGFSAVFFRRETPQIRNPGGMWDESLPLYRRFSALPLSSVLEHKFPSGARVKFSHMEREDDRFSWDGAQVPLICFDQLEHFTKIQFFYMLSRNRSACGVRPYIRATCNPDADSWLAEFLAWWIDQETGFPIAERAGILRWFIRDGDLIIWADSREELIEKSGDAECDPKSVTFIPGTVQDNRKLLDIDHGYLSNLKSLNRVERARLLGGNWKVRPSSGMYFNRSECTVVDSLPSSHDTLKKVRRWDLAATEVTEESPNPDWTAGILMMLQRNGRYLIADLVHDRKRSNKIRELVKRVANNDGHSVKICLSQDPGQAGKEQAESYVSELAGYTVKTVRETGEKTVRANPFSSQWQAGNVDVLRGVWNEALFNELESFGGDTGHDDIVDACSGAFLELATNNLSVWSNLGK